MINDAVKVKSVFCAVHVAGLLDFMVPSPNRYTLKTYPSNAAVVTMIVVPDLKLKVRGKTSPGVKTKFSVPIWTCVLRMPSPSSLMVNM